MDRRVDDGFATRDEALVLQSKEYERRLGDLNHEAARIAAAAEKSVNREVYDVDRQADRAARDVAKERVDEALKIAKEAADRAVGAGSGRADLVRWVFAVAAFVATCLAIAAFAAR